MRSIQKFYLGVGMFKGNLVAKGGQLETYIWIFYYVIVSNKFEFTRESLDLPPYSLDLGI